VACLVLVSFGYTSLPFWPQGRNYEAFFTDAAGIAPGNDVSVSGIKVGHVESVGLAGTAAKVKFTVDRKVRVGGGAERSDRGPRRPQLPVHGVPRQAGPDRATLP
jgi:ABC-type transporter Mla subunit MlaD